MHENQPILDDLCTQMMSLSQLLRQRMSKQAVPLSIPRIKVLSMIAEETKREPPTMKALADRMGVTPSSATSFIDALVHEELVDRVHDTTDRRVIRLGITQKGRDMLAQGKEAMTKELKELFTSLTREEQESLNGILKKLLTTYGF